MDISTFPCLHNRNSIVDLDITNGLVLSGEREEIYTWAARSLLECGGEVNEVELIEKDISRIQLQRRKQLTSR